MEIKDLRIGDYVKYQNNSPCYRYSEVVSICGITNVVTLKDFYNEAGKFSEKINQICACGIEPIPIVNEHFLSHRWRMAISGDDEYFMGYLLSCKWLRIKGNKCDG